MELTLSKRYLSFPVKTGAAKRKLTLAIADGPTREFEVELAPGAPDFWAWMDVGPFPGRTATLSAEMTDADAVLARAITQDDGQKGTANLYHEALRPRFHFSSRRGWNNDPNGLVCFQGEYHLFYQHNPYGWSWGNMHWGHAVSPDLVHWRELPIALYPDALGACFSGSAVVDWRNMTGFQTCDEPPLVCIYTAAGDPFTQCLAYSNDRGRTFQLYAGNPVLGHIVGTNRDPKVIWYAPEQKWIMALYLDGNDFALFASPDLKHWERLSDVRITDCTECPDFFEIPVEGLPGENRWVFYGGNGRYLVGRFDGVTFTPESGPHALHYGNCFYASQTYNDIPEADGRRVLIAWGTVAMPGMPFNQMMAFPVELTLRNTADGPRLGVAPAREIASLRTREHRWSNVRLPAPTDPLAGVEGELFDLTAEFAVQSAAQVGLVVRGVAVTYDAEQQTLTCDGCTAPLVPVDGTITLRLLVDRTSIEIFAHGGQVYMPVGVLLADAPRTLEVVARGGEAELRSLQVHELCSAWLQQTDAAPGA